jgi:hypothetical protein
MRQANKKVFFIKERYKKGFETYIFKKLNGKTYRTKDEFSKVGLEIESGDMIFENEEDYWDEVEYRAMQAFISAFGDLRLYAFEYSPIERMEIYAPELFI